MSEKAKHNAVLDLFKGKGVASEEQKNDESVKGFAGLSSMMSDVDDAVTAEEIKRSNTSPEVAPIERSMPPPQPVRQTKQSPEPYQKPIQQPSDDPSFVKWWIGVGVVILLIWLSTDQENKNTLPVSTAPTQSSQIKPTQSQQVTPSSTNSPQDTFDRANDLYSQGKYAEAFPLYRNLAQYSGAQIKLGEMYESGNGVIKDFNQAAYWYRKAAEIGDENEKDAKMHIMALNKIEGSGYSVTRSTSPAQTQAQARLAAKAQAQLDVKAQTQARLEAQAQARLEAQTQALAQTLAQARAALAQAQAKAAADKLGVTLPDGGIVFYVDSSGSHGLEAKAADEPDLLDWADAIDASRDYGSGWRLPTSDELQLLYEQKTVVGGFAAGNYWSSTKSENRTVWRQNFYDGVTHYQPMDDELRVRAVRAF